MHLWVAAMSIKIMTQVWEITLPDSEKIALLALADCANDEGGCWPSMATLARKCSKGERTLQKAIKSLCDKGPLRRDERRGKGVYYTVHPRSDDTHAVGAPPQGTTETPAEVAGDPRRHFGQTDNDPFNNRQSHTPETLSKDKKETVGASQDDDQECEEVVEHWCRVAVPEGAPSIRRLTAKRRKAIKARLKAEDLSTIKEVIDRLAKSSWLLGKTDKSDWKADLLWMLKPDKFDEILEGKHDDRKRGPRPYYETMGEPSTRRTAQMARQKLGIDGYDEDGWPSHDIIC